MRCVTIPESKEHQNATPTTHSHAILIPFCLLHPSRSPYRVWFFIQGVAVSQALPLGFTAIDTAHHYMCQTGVAAGIKEAGVARDKVWITTKVEACNNSYVRLEHCSDDTMDRFEDDLQRLNTGYVDLMLLHAPTSTAGGENVYPHLCECSSPAACVPMQQQWAILESMYGKNIHTSLRASLSLSLSLSLALSLARSLARSLALSLARSLARSLSLSRSLVLSRSLALPRSLALMSVHLTCS
jgi:hypothetical protein